MESQFTNTPDQKPELTETGLAFLKEIAKWGYFLSIIGFIGIGFIVLIAIFAGSISGMMMNSMPGFVSGSFITVMYLVTAFLYFFPVYYLFRFSRGMLKAISNNSAEELTNALEFLKSHYKFIGILTIILLGVYALMFFFGLLGVLVAG